MLLQNELKLSKILLSDIIERDRFNKYSVYNPNGATDDDKLKNFNNNLMQMYDYIK